MSNLITSIRRGTLSVLVLMTGVIFNRVNGS